MADSTQEILIKTDGNIREGTQRVNKAIQDATSIVNYEVASAEIAIDNTIQSTRQTANQYRNQYYNEANQQIDNYFNLIDFKISEVVDKFAVQKGPFQKLMDITNGNYINDAIGLMSKINSTMQEFYAYGGYVLGNPVVDLSTPQQIYRNAIAKWEDVQSKAVNLYADVKSQAFYLYENAVDVLAGTAIDIADYQVKKTVGLDKLQILHVGQNAWRAYKKYKLAQKKKLKEAEETEENKEEPTKTAEEKKLERKQKKEQLKQQKQQAKKKRKEAKAKKKKEIKSVKTSEFKVAVNVDVLKAEFISQLEKLSTPIYNAIAAIICVDEIQETLQQFKNITMEKNLTDINRAVKMLANVINLYKQIGISSEYPADLLKDINLQTFFNVFNNLTSSENLKRVVSLSSTTTFTLSTDELNQGKLTLTLYTNPNTESKKLQSLLDNIELWDNSQVKYIMDNAKTLYTKWLADKKSNDNSSLTLTTKSKDNQLNIEVTILCSELAPVKSYAVGSTQIKDTYSHVDKTKESIISTTNQSISTTDISKTVDDVKTTDNKVKSIINNSIEQNQVETVKQQIKSDSTALLSNSTQLDFQSLKSDTIEQSVKDPSKKQKIQAPFLTTLFKLMEQLAPLFDTFAVIISNYTNNKNAALNASSINIDAINKQFINDKINSNHNIAEVDASNYNVYFVRTKVVENLVEETVNEHFESESTTDNQYTTLLNSSISTQYKNIKIFNLEETAYFKLLLDEEGYDSTDIEEGYYTLLIIEISDSNDESLNGSAEGLDNVVYINSENKFYIDITDTSLANSPSQILLNYYKQANPFYVESEDNSPIDDFSDLVVHTDEMEGEQILSLKNLDLCDTEEVESTGLTEDDIITNISDIISSNKSPITSIVEVGQPTIDNPSFGKSFKFFEGLTTINNHSVLGDFVDSDGTTKTIKSIFGSGQVRTANNDYVHLYPNNPHNRHIIIDNCELNAESSIDIDQVTELANKMGEVGVLETFIVDNLNYSILPNILLRRKELKDGYVDEYGSFVYYAMLGYSGTEIYTKWKTHIDNTIDNYYEVKGISKKTAKKRGKEICEKEKQKIKNTKGNSDKLQSIAQEKIDKRDNFLYGKHLISEEKNGIIDLYESYKDNPTPLINGGVLDSDMIECRYSQSVTDDKQELGLADCYGLGKGYYLSLLEDVDTLSDNSYINEYYNLLCSIIQKHNAFENVDESVIKQFIIEECKDLNFTNLSYKEVVNKLDNEFDNKPSINEVYNWLKGVVYISDDDLEVLESIANLYVYYRSIDKDYIIEKTVTNGDGTYRDLTILDLIEEDKRLLESFWSKVIADFKANYNLRSMIGALKELNDKNQNIAQWPEPVELIFDDEIYRLYTFTDNSKNNIEDESVYEDENTENIVTELPEDISEYQPDLSYDINDLTRTEPNNTNNFYTLKYWKKYFSLATLISLPYTATGIVVKHIPILMPAIFVPFFVVYQKTFNLLLVIGLSIRGVYFDPIVLYINTSSDYSSSMTPLLNIMQNVYHMAQTKINLIDLNIVSLAKVYKEQLLRENNNLKKELSKLKELQKGLAAVKVPSFKNIEDEFKGYFAPINQYIRRSTDLINKANMDFVATVHNASTAYETLRHSVVKRDEENAEKENNINQELAKAEESVNSTKSLFDELKTTTNNNQNTNSSTT